MLRSRIGRFLGSKRRTGIRLLQGLLISAALGGAVAWFVAGSASASSSPNPPPMTGPITDPLPGGGSGGTTTSPGGTIPPAAASRCTRAQLHLKFVDMQGATGHRYIDYAFKNVGTGDCTLRGYADATLLNSSGHALHGAGEQVGQWTISPVRTVVLLPGKRAFFTFTWTAGGFCPGHNFAFDGVRMLPPNDPVGFARRLGFTGACGNSAMVSAVRHKLSL